MRGYQEYPNMRDLERMLSKLRSEKQIKGNVYNYGVLPEGLKHVTYLLTGVIDNNNQAEASIAARRDIQQEIQRLLNTKVFNYYKKTQNIEPVESDFFEFVGISPRSLSPSGSQSAVPPKYSFLIDDVIPFCKKNAKQDSNLEMIVKLWEILLNKFGKLILGEKNE